MVIVQQNATEHTINWIQIKQFAKANNRNVIFFPIKHSCIKKTTVKLLIIETC